MNGGDVRGLSQFSLGLFGNKHKLSVLVAIHELTADGSPDVYARQVSKEVPDAADNQVAVVIRQLESAGLLERVEDKTETLRHFYRVRDVSLWSAMAALQEELRDASWLVGLTDD